VLWREGLAGGYYNNIIIIYFIIIVGRWRARGGQVYFRWATCKKVGPIFLFSKNLIIIFFFEELLVCVCGYKVVYMCVGVRSTTLLQFKVENALLRISFFRFYWIGFQKLKKSFFSNFHTFSLSLKNV